MNDASESAALALIGSDRRVLIGVDAFYIL
jgi:hypothetical protein